MNLNKIEIQQWELDRLIPYDRNPRKNDHVIEPMAKAIKTFGFLVPLMIKSNGELIDGHLRLKAAIALNMEQVPVVLCDDLTDAQIKAFRISINRMAELAGWDFELLWEEMQYLEQKGYDLDLTGWDKDARAEIQTAGKITDPFSIPATTIFDARKGEWQDRKRTWMTLGIKSEQGRGRAE